VDGEIRIDLRKQRSWGMRNFVKQLGMATLGTIVLLLGAGKSNAQITASTGVNPLTGQITTVTAGFNPLTNQVGTSSLLTNPITGQQVLVGVGQNPLTGTISRTEIVRNPFTGATVTVQQRFNPITNNFRVRTNVRVR
jgi:hypothetical protein